MLELLNLFANTPVFRSFSESEQHKLLHLVNRRVLEKGDFLSLSGDLLPYVTILSEGALIITKESSEGRILNMRTLAVGSVIWGHALFDCKPTLGTIRATEPSVVYQWKGTDILPVLRENKHALWELSLALHQRMREASNTIEKLAFSCVSSRLAQLLLVQFEKSEPEPISRRLMTLDNIASEIGTTKEVVCRLLHRYDKHKIIVLTRKQFVLKDKKKLEKVANGNDAILFGKSE